MYPFEDLELGLCNLPFIIIRAIGWTPNRPVVFTLLIEGVFHVKICVFVSLLILLNCLSCCGCWLILLENSDFGR